MTTEDNTEEPKIELTLNEVRDILNTGESEIRKIIGSVEKRIGKSVKVSLSEEKHRDHYECPVILNIDIRSY